jgi:iron complex outermembrane receptor protein
VAAVCTGGSLIVALPPGAHAQDAAVSRRAAVLEQVLVTAQRREQAQQEVPISIQVVGTDLLDDVAADDLGDLTVFVPGLDISSESPTQPRYSIRGIRSNDFGVGTDPSVGVYVDGVYTARSGASLLTFNDIERIEVLKGPQGTLFGRNSAAGAISIATRQPADDFDALLRLRVGEFDRRRVEGMVNVPLRPDIALRVNGVYNESNGWVQDATTGRDLRPEESWAFRAALRWNLAAQTVATLTWDRDEIDQLARPAFGVVPVDPGGGIVPFPPDPATFLDPRKAPVFNDVIGNEESRELDALTLAVVHELGWAELRSTTAWRQFDTLNREDEDGTNRVATYFDTANIEDNESWYQEFKLSGKAGSIDWVAGASYYQEDARQASDTLAFTDSVDTVIRNVQPLATPDGSLFGYTSAALAASGSPISLLGEPWRETMFNEGDFSATAVFWDGIWHVTDRLNWTVGVRYTHDSKDFSWLNGPREAPGLDASLALLQAAGFFATFPIPPEAYQSDLVFALPPGIEGSKVRRSDSWEDVSPRFVIDYEVRPDVMLFGSLTKGYKAGGYNSVEVGSRFDNEDVWNLEAGVKSVFARVGLAFNASAYYYVYEDKQSIALVQGATGSGVPQYLVDTSDVEAFGIDAELRWQPFDEVTLYANVAFIDATYDDKVALDGADLSGEPTGEPYLSAALGASYVWLLGPNGLVDLSTQFGYRGEARCNRESRAQGVCQVSPSVPVGDAQSRLDARLAWKNATDRWGLAAFVTNLLDDQYVTRAHNITASTLGTPFASVSEPRAWGVEAFVSF